MKSKKTFIITIIICFIPIVVGLLFYNTFPDTMPIHFDINGEADGYANKFLAIVILPLILLATHLFLWFMLSQDPKKYNQYPFMLTIARYMTPALSLIINGLIYLKAWGYKMNISFIILILVGVLFILLGNYMPKVKQNYTMGIRTPWTLNDEGNWIKTHRFGGKVFVFVGVCMMFLAFIKQSTWYLILLIVVSVLLIYIYSYIIYRREKNVE